MSIKVLSIFSGGGGIDCGFKKAGYDICFSTDFWQPACDTLEKNKVGRLVRCADIRQVDYAKELASIGLSVCDIDVFADFGVGDCLLFIFVFDVIIFRYFF